jgi:hypothetical protein
MPRRVLAFLGLAGFAVSLAITLANGKAEPSPTVAGPPPLGDIGAAPKFRPQAELLPSSTPRDVGTYRDAGAWVDQYDAEVMNDPYPALLEMKEHGVRTVYLETGSWRLPRRLDFRDKLGVSLAIDQAHGLGMKVVGWYLPGLDDVPLDMRRTRAALDLRTERGGKFDGWAVDIESQRVRPIGRRNAALMRYSRALRRLVGSDYALGAIVPDQRSSTVSPGLWPGLPYAAVASVYDIFLPMAYSTYRGHGSAFAYSYTRSNVEFVRAATRRPVHLIGGLEPLAGGEPAAVVRGAMDGGAIGASFYDFVGATDLTWRALGALAAASPSGRGRSASAR